MLPGRVVSDGLLSDAQLESIVLAGEAHSCHLAADYRIGSAWETVQRCDEDGLPRTRSGGDADGDADDAESVSESVTADGEMLSAPVRFRRGWMLGDGTGAGKGRQVAAIVLDNWLRGRRRALWLSQSDKLLEDARRDWTALGGREDDVFPISNFRQGAEIPLAEGILFATYATLRSPARQGKLSRLDQIVRWLAGGLDEDDRHAFDGAVIFDEAHAMANAAGSKGNRGEVKPSQQGRAGLRLQNALARRPHRLCLGDRRHHRPRPRLCRPARPLGCRRHALRHPGRFRLRHGGGRRRRDGSGRAGFEGARSLPGSRAFL